MNYIQNSTRVCTVPATHGVGGMVTFQDKFSKGLKARNIEVTYDLKDRPYQSVLVVGGIKNIPTLLKARKNGIHIVQRLDGINWLHTARVRKHIRNFNLRTFMRAEYGNRVLFLIREHISNSIIYQSEFVRKWWLKVRGSTEAAESVIHNGVDLEQYKPNATIKRPADKIRILLIEGSLMGGYEAGLEVVMNLIKMLASSKLREFANHIELVVVGKVTETVRNRWMVEMNQLSYDHQVSINWMGVVPIERIPEINNSAHFLYSSDINAACPNSVIEAMSCGNPVLSFDTGALPELVTPGAGRIVPYGADPWKLEPPDMNTLALGAVDLLENQQKFRSGARLRAENSFSLDKMLDAYMDILLG